MRDRSRSASGLALLTTMFFLRAAPLPALEVELERVTGKPFAAGESGNFVSQVLQMSPDGRFLLIQSRATNLMAGILDTNGENDLLVFDRETGGFDLVTRSYGDASRTALSQIGTAAMSADGRFVAFSSSGHPHAPGSTGQMYQIYLYDRVSETTVKVTHPPGNPQGHGNGASWIGLTVSQDGRYVAYESDATNLAAGPDDNHGSDIFQYDRITGVNTLVTHRAGVPTATATGRGDLRGMSADGRYVVFLTRAIDLVAGFVDHNGGSVEDAFLWDRDTNSSTLVSHAAGAPLAGANAAVNHAMLAAGGSHAAIATAATNLVPGFVDGNGAGESDAYVYERSTGALQLVSGLSATTAQNGHSIPLALSADGAYLFFISKASDVLPGLVRPADDGYGLFRFTAASRQVALINHQAGQPVAIASGEAYLPRIAADGEALLFSSASGELVAGQTASGGQQVFFYDMATGNARLVSHLAGQPLAGADGEPIGLGADHGYAAFNSASPALEAGDDDNTYTDAFLYDLGQASASRLSSAAVAGRKASGSSFEKLESIPAAGLFLFHASDVTGFLPGITDHGGFDPVLLDPRSGALTALLAPGGITPDGDSRATFLPDGLSFLLRANGSQLVPGMTDGNGAGADLYVGNRTRGGLQLISSSAASATTSANQTVGSRAVFSANGRFVAYDTFATDAVAGAGDGNGAEDVILHDRQLGTRALVSRAATPSLQSGNAKSYPVSMSADGELLLFASRATDLVPSFVDRNGASGEDYYLYRRGAGTVTLVTHDIGSPSHGGTFTATSGRLSADGSLAIFASTSRNLVAPGTDHNSNGDDLFAYATATGAISRLSHRPGDPLHGVNGDTQLVHASPDLRYLLLNSAASDLVSGGTVGPLAYQTFVYDRALDQATLISHQLGLPTTTLDQPATAVTMSDDARFVVFRTAAANVVAGQVLEALMHDYSLFVVDRASGQRAVLSRGLSGPTTTGNSFSQQAAIGPDGRHAIFLSTATNLSPHLAVPGSEVYLADLAAGGGELFADGFELGTTAAWSQTTGGN